MRLRYYLLGVLLGITANLFGAPPSETLRATYCPAPASPSGWSSGGEIGKNPPQNGSFDPIRLYDRQLLWCDRSRDPKCSNVPAD